MTGVNPQIVHDRAREVRENIQKICQYTVLPDRVLDCARHNLSDFAAYLKTISEIVGQPI